MICQFSPKSPGEEYYLEFDFAAALARISQTIVSIISVSAVDSAGFDATSVITTPANQNNTATSVRIWAMGGINGEDYTITVKILGNGCPAAALEMDAVLPVREIATRIDDPTATLPGRLIQNQIIGSWVDHPIDIYIPPVNITRALVLLHGGSGSKENFARNLGIIDQNQNINWDLLAIWHIMVIIPQGSYCNGVVGDFNPHGVVAIDAEGVPVRTWSNHQMWSQSDDKQFLIDLSAWITSNFGHIYPTLGKNLCGHSQGAAMVFRMWYEAPNNFNHYCTVSGTPSYYYHDHPGLPDNIRPIFMQIGLIDDVLSVSDGPLGPGDHFFDAYWQQGESTVSVADVYQPLQWIGAWPFLQTAVNALGDASIISPDDGVITSVPAGTKTEWAYAGGQAKLELLSAADHTIASHQQCTGNHVLGDWMNFINL